MSRTFPEHRTQSGVRRAAAYHNCNRSMRVSACALAACVATLGALVSGAHPTAFIATAHANEKQDEKPTAMKAYDSGVKAFNAGKSQQAIDQLSSALRIGGLGTSELARAMYLRGLAYKKQNKPGLAISDLTSAVWIKNGLNEADRQKALAERQEAYAAAGISGSDVAAAPAVSQGPPPAPASQPTAVATAPTTATDSNLTLTDPSVSATAPSAATPSVSASTAVSRSSAPVSGGMTDAISGRYDSAPRVVATAPAVQPSAFATETTTAPSATATSSSPPSSSGSSFGSGIAQAPAAIGNFFSNLFSGDGSSTTQTAATPSLGYAPDSMGAPPVPAGNSIVAGPVGAPAYQAPQTDIPPFTTAAIPASDARSAARTATPSAPVAAAPRPVPAARPTASATSKVYKGRYKLHIAATRARADAETIASKLAAQHGGDLDSRTPSVDEAVIGSMGTFYRVRVGGYAKASQPKAICEKLRTSGFDCLVVTN